MSKVQPDLIEQAKDSGTAAWKECERLTIPSSRQALRQKFIDALKSGKYTQVSRTLRASIPQLMFLSVMKHESILSIGIPTIQYAHAFCAIGLAYELLGKKWPQSNGEVYMAVAEAYGLKTSEVVKLNDGGFTFEEIAQMLETHPWTFWENSSTYQW